MTIVCATNDGLSGIRACTELSEHRITCPDHLGWEEKLRPGTCRGCLPLDSDIEFLCRTTTRGLPADEERKTA